MGDSGWLGTWLPKALFKSFTSKAPRKRRASASEVRTKEVLSASGSQDAATTSSVSNCDQKKRQKLTETHTARHGLSQLEHSLTLLQHQQQSSALPQPCRARLGHGLSMKNACSGTGCGSNVHVPSVAPDYAGLRQYIFEPRRSPNVQQLPSAASDVQLRPTVASNLAHICADKKGKQVFHQLPNLSMPVIHADNGTSSKLPTRPECLRASRHIYGHPRCAASTSALPVPHAHTPSGSPKCRSTCDLRRIPSVVRGRHFMDSASAPGINVIAQRIAQQQKAGVTLPSRVETCTTAANAYSRAQGRAITPQSCSQRILLQQRHAGISKEPPHALQEARQRQLSNEGSLTLPDTSLRSVPVVAKRVELEYKSTLFSSPIKCPASEAESLEAAVFGHRILKPLVSKLPQENFNAFVEIHRHAKKHCEAETVELLIRDKELIYYSRGNHHRSTTQHQDTQNLPQCTASIRASSRPAWAEQAALVLSLRAQKATDPFSVFGDAPPELLLHEIYRREHYNALGPRSRATHPVLRKFERYFEMVNGCVAHDSTINHDDCFARLAARFDGPITEDVWNRAILPALLSWWRNDTCVELDWRHDPLTTDDCAWYLQAIGAWEDLTDIVTIKQPCFCPTPPPQKEWTWMDSRLALRRSLAVSASHVQQRAASPDKSTSLTSRAYDIARSADLGFAHVSTVHRQTTAILEAPSPITPGIRKDRQRPWVSRHGNPRATAIIKQRQTDKKLAPNSVQSPKCAQDTSEVLSGELHKLLHAAQCRLESLEKRSRIADRPHPCTSNLTAFSILRCSKLRSVQISEAAATKSGAQ